METKNKLYKLLHKEIEDLSLAEKKNPDEIDKKL